ncbi:MAG: tripartite tricarboxylate transporter TctB family protein [Pseudomonadota bacterium]
MSDRIFGLVMLCVAVGYIATATQIQTSFLSDPVGPKTFPYMVGCVVILCSIMILIKPDAEPEWPGVMTFARLLLAVIVLAGYAMTLKPLGFLLPTAIAAGVISYQISPRAVPAALTGVGLSAGLFIVFKYMLGLGLFAVPRDWLG